MLVDHLHVAFDQRFVFRVAHPCRKYSRIVVMGHLYHQGVNFRLIFVSLSHGAFEVVRHKYLRYTAIVFQRMAQALGKALLSLARTGFYICILTIAEGCEQDFRIFDFARGSVYIWYLLTGVIDIELVSGLVLHMHGYIHCPSSFTIELAELRIAVSVRIGKPVLIP